MHFLSRTGVSGLAPLPLSTTAPLYCTLLLKSKCFLSPSLQTTSCGAGLRKSKSMRSAELDTARDRHKDAGIQLRACSPALHICDSALQQALEKRASPDPPLGAVATAFYRFSTGSPAGLTLAARSVSPRVPCEPRLSTYTSTSRGLFSDASVTFHLPTPPPLNNVI